MLWLILGLMTLAALGFVLFPVWRRETGAVARGPYGVAIYRDQLSEIARDLERGLLSAEEAAAATIEIERHLLAAARNNGGPAVAEAGPPSRRRAALLAAVLALLVPAAAGSIYLYLGAPGQPGQPFAAREAERAEATGASKAEIQALAANLAARLKQSPDDLRGWLLLASTYTWLERFDDAAIAYSRAIPLGRDEPETLAEITAAYGETLVLASGGTVTPVARAAFTDALKNDAANHRARYYLGLAELQEGKTRAALEIWVDLAAGAAPDAPWLGLLRERIQRLSKEAGIDTATLAPREKGGAESGPQKGSRPGASGADAEAARNINQAQRRATIEAMVAGLAARLESQPDDAEGWLRLGRSYRVLGKPANARDAYARAAKLRPKDVAILLDFADALYEAAGRPRPLPEKFVAVMDEVIALDPGNRDALWYLGLAASEAGEADKAAGFWRRLSQRLPAGTPERLSLESRIEALGKEGGKQDDRPPWAAGGSKD